MSISPGHKLGSYEILSQLGAGGMGEVYRARDTTLGREVAIKVLPDAFAQDTERLARFEREARLLASLNHPNIATIHGLEQSGDARFLVMELVPGETLADRIKTGALPLEEALPLFMQIAEGLEAAHKKGVIHRDLKPANIKLTPDEKAKVLDFGLAKAAVGAPSEDSSESPTITKAATETGVILGTAGYMSPEQARGKTVDKRTDIWAFGCCFYEALTGQITFQGDTLSDTIASVLRQDPDWKALPETTPKTVRRLLGRCLQKDPRRRFRDAWDVRIELEEALGELKQPSRAVSAPRTSGWRRAVPWIAATLLATGVAIWALVRVSPPAVRPLTRLTLSTSPLGGGGRTFDVSPDGTRLAFIGEVDSTRKLFLRSMDRLEATPIEGTNGAEEPFFSPDGEWVGFVIQGKIKKVPAAGGTPFTLCDVGRHLVPLGPNWGQDDRIYFHNSSVGPGVSWVSAAGGTPQQATTPREGDEHRWPYVLPGATALLTTVHSRETAWADKATLAVVSLETGEYRPLLEEAGHFARYVPTGHLVYVREGGLRAVPFDLERLEVTGQPIPVLEMVAASPVSGKAQFVFSENGSLLYVPGTTPTASLVWVDRNGNAQLVTDMRRAYFDPRISPDGRRIAVNNYQEANTDIWVYDIARGTLSRLTTAESDEEVNRWTPDSQRLTFYSNRAGSSYNLFWKPADASGPTERLTESEQNHIPQSFSPDGRVLAYLTNSDIWMLPIDGERKAEPFLETPFNEGGAEFSPDGRWIAYVSNESDRYEVYVRPYPGPGERWQISTDGGLEPSWRPDGTEIYYRTRTNLGRGETDQKMMVVPVSLTPEFAPGRPRVLFQDRFDSGASFCRNYDIAPDGRFLMVDRPEESPNTSIVVVLNWFEELKRLVPTE